MGQIVTADLIKSLLPGLRTEFNKGWDGIVFDYTQVATTVDSTLATETYAWLGQAPTLRQWTDERIPKGLSEYSYTIKNLKWENSIRVAREVLEDEQYGQVKLRVSQLPKMAALGQSKTVFTLFNNAASTVGYDGANFASTSHSEGNSGTQSNYSASGLALNATNYAIARANMTAFKSDQGELVGSMPTHLMVPRALEGVARQLLNADFVTDGTAGGGGISNIWKGSAELIVCDWLTSATTWFLLDLSAYIKPIIFQNRVTTEFDELTNATDSSISFMRDEFLFGTRGRWNVGVSDWRTMYMASA